MYERGHAGLWDPTTMIGTREPHSSKEMSSQTSVGSQRWLLEASGVGSAATREDPGQTHQPCRCKSPSWGFLPHPQTANHTSGLLFALTSHHVAPSHPFAFAPGWLRRPSRAGLGRQAWRVSREHLAVREEMHQPLFTLGEPREDTHCVHLEVKAQTTTIWSSVPACMCACACVRDCARCMHAGKQAREKRKR